MKCTFCGKIVPEGTGKVYVKKDGKVFNFCSLKCEKNQLKLKRKSVNVKWTEKHHLEKAKMSTKNKKEETKVSTKEETKVSTR